VECIIEGSSSVLQILGKQKEAKTELRMSKYCLTVPVDGGMLLFNILTRQLLWLTREEYAQALSSDYLRTQWFTVPQEQKEWELAELVRWVHTGLRDKPKHITHYTILTTTACNARCYYCYEQGCTPISMTPETADRVVSYIARSYGGEKVNLSWFGGEPLMNTPAIDRISAGLRQQGIDFEAAMTSNAYLFDDDITNRAIQSWNLKNVQITLDGTHQVYNRTKAYVYKDTDPYQVVMENISRLLHAGILVVIRLNVGHNNGQDLLQLAHTLAERFEGEKRLRVYAHFLFDPQNAQESRYTREEWAQFRELKSYLQDRGIAAGSKGLGRELPVRHCMADKGNAVVIVPDGHLGLCEHHAEDEFFGHIDASECDREMIASWQEPVKTPEACGDCLYFPECTELKKCSGNILCNHMALEMRRYETEQAMLREYHLWRDAKHN